MECMHVRDLGLLSEKDWHLLQRIREEDWTLVTNNVEEFRARYRRRRDLHAGVVFLVASAGIEAQKGALDAALDDIDRDGNLMNTEVLVEPHGGDTASAGLICHDPQSRACGERVIEMSLTGGRKRAESAMMPPAAGARPAQ